MRKTINIPVKKAGLFFLMALCTQCGLSQVRDTMASHSADTAAITQTMIKEAVKTAFIQSPLYQDLQKSKLQQMLADTSLIDSIGKMVINRLNVLKNRTASNVKTTLEGTLRSSGDLLRRQLDAAPHTSEIRTLISQYMGLKKKSLLQYTDGSVTIEGQMAPSMFDEANTFVSSNTISTGWSVLGIPLGLRLVRQDFAGDYNYSKNTLTLEFNRQAYLNTMRRALQSKFNEEGMLQGYLGLLQQAKLHAFESLKPCLEEITQLYKGVAGLEFMGLGSMDSLLTTDIAVLESKLRPAAMVQQIAAQKLKLLQLQQGVYSDSTAERLRVDSIARIVQAVQKVDVAISKIKVFREEAIRNGWSKLSSPGVVSRVAGIKDQLLSADDLTAMAKQELGLNGLQSVFLYIQQLKAGLNTVSLSPLTVYQFFNNGINTAFCKNKLYVFVMAAKQKAMNGMLDARPVLPGVFSNNTALGVRVGRGDTRGSYTHFSLFNYKQTRDANSFMNNPAVPGNTSVSTISSRLQLNATNYIQAELSKSSHRYDNQSAAYDTLQMGGTVVKRLVSGGSMMQQMAFDLQLAGENPDRELSYSLYAGSIGKAYTNPGNYFLLGGTTEFGSSIRKNFLQSRLRLSAGGHYRAFSYGQSATSWRSSNYTLQASWKFNKAQHITIKYQPFHSSRVQGGVKQPVTANKRLGVEGLLRRRFHTIMYQHTLSITAISSLYHIGAAGIQNNAVQLNSMQTFMVNRKSWYVNMQYNRSSSPSDFLLFNTQFTAEAGLGYTIRNRLTGTTTLNYRSIQHWVRQAGIRQSINGQVSKKCTLSLYADIVKTIQVHKAIYAGGPRFDWSLQYLLK
jgi:hypothetical protein